MCPAEQAEAARVAKEEADRLEAQRLAAEAMNHLRLMRLLWVLLLIFEFLEHVISSMSKKNGPQFSLVLATSKKQIMFRPSFSLANVKLAA